MEKFFNSLQQLTDSTVLDVSITRIIIAFFVLLLVLVARKLASRFFANLLEPMTVKAEEEGRPYARLFIVAVQRPVNFLILIGGIFIAINIVELPTSPIDLRSFSVNLVRALTTGAAAWAIFNLVSIPEAYFLNLVRRSESNLDDHLVPFVRKSLRIFILLLGGLMIIQNLGYSISGLLASLGIGGLAFALAAKDTISNIFGSIMILLDRPFNVGDWIKAGEMEGTVEEIGFRSTKIRTFAKTLITVPNNVIANLEINNFSRMPKRRIKMNVGVTYDAKPAQVRKAVETIRQMLRDHPAIDQEFFLVNFTDFGASSLDIMVYCFTVTTDWQAYLDAREDVCLKIMEIVGDLGMAIAFPSQTLYLHQEDGVLTGVESSA